MLDESRVRKLRREEPVRYGLCACWVLECFAAGIRDEDVAAFRERAATLRCPRHERDEREKTRRPITAAQRAADWPDD